MTTPQPGISALGTPEHCYLELDLEPGATAGQLVRRVAGLTGPLSATGGVSLVVGIRPELWAEVAPGDAPADAASWTEDLVGAGRYRMPATQHDAWVWVAGGDRTAVFDNARAGRNPTTRFTPPVEDSGPVSPATPRTSSSAVRPGSRSSSR